MGQNAEVARYLSPADIRDATRPESYIGTAVSQVNESSRRSATSIRTAMRILRKTVLSPAGGSKSRRK